MYYDIEIKKPLYKYFVYIRDTKIYQAKKAGLLLRIKTPDGIWVISPIDFLKDAKRMEKVFLRPGEPMVLFGNYITKGEKYEPEDDTQEIQNDTKEPETDFKNYWVNMGRLINISKQVLKSNV